MNNGTKITFLGQSGLLFETNGKVILVDPYMSNSVVKVNPANFRRQPIDTRFLDIQPDVIILTHDHQDHTDLETLSHYLTRDIPVLVLAAPNAWSRVRTLGGVHNYVQFPRRTQWTYGTIRVQAVRAVHSDEHAIGIIVDDGEKKYYVTGDTLYNSEIFSDLPDDIFAVFLPVNGMGNNMNQTDAKRFAIQCGAQKVIPIHFGMFDSIKPEGFEIVPEVYKEIIL